MNLWLGALIQVTVHLKRYMTELGAWREFCVVFNGQTISKQSVCQIIFPCGMKNFIVFFFFLKLSENYSTIQKSQLRVGNILFYYFLCIETHLCIIILILYDQNFFNLLNETIACNYSLMLQGHKNKRAGILQ